MCKSKMFWTYLLSPSSICSRQESEQQQNTCVFLKRQSEQLQEKCDELNLHLESLKVWRWSGTELLFYFPMFVFAEPTFCFNCKLKPVTVKKNFYFCFIKACFNAHTPVVAVIQNSELYLFSSKKLKTVVAAAFDCHIIKKRTFREVSY